jgi:acetyltransferase-like isoleucine patch superfamily enzyme
MRDYVRLARYRLNRRFALRENVRLGRNVHIGIGSSLWAPRELVVGDDVYIGNGCTIEVDGTIGDDVLIANAVGIVGRFDHAVRQVGTPVRRADWVGDHPERLSRPVAVGDDVWIGYGAVVLSGLAVGRGAVVAAGSVVASDVAPYDIVAGNPARPIGRRFADDEIAAHETMLASARPV